eukprot:c18244_g1_i2 orf=1067-4768(+)
MGFNMRGDKNSLALLSSKRGKAYSRTRADEAFALPSFSDAMPIATAVPQLTSNAIVRPPEHHAEHGTENAIVRPPEHHAEHGTENAIVRPPEHHAEHGTENVKQTMLQHESLFKEQLHELHRLYEKQCVLMAESKKGHACHPRSEPPSSNNSSVLFNPDTVRPQEDRSFGDTSVKKEVDSNRNLCAFPSQIDDVKPYEVNAASKKQRCRPMFDLERPAEGWPMFDLERPAEEYLDVEVVEEKPRAACRLGDASALVHNHASGENKDPISGENKNFASGEKKGMWGNKQSGFCGRYDVRRSDSMCEGEKMYEGYLQQEILACKGPGFNELRGLPTAPSMTPNSSHQESYSHSIEVSGLYQRLPDLNGELNSAEQSILPIQRKPEQNVRDRQYIDLEADPRAPFETSKLPHWLCQRPPTVSPKPLPFNFRAQASDWQQKATLISPPQMHGETERPSYLTWGHGEMLKTSATQESYYRWPQSGTSFQQGQISFREPPPTTPSLGFCSVASAGAADGSYKGADTRGLVKESFPSFLSHVRESGKVDKLNASGYLTSHSMDRQGMKFERSASTELLSRISSTEATALSTSSPWYQQRESFSSLMHKASNPEPPIHRPPHASSVSSPLGICANQQALPMERGVFGMHTSGSSAEGLLHLVTRPESSTTGPVFDIMHVKSELGPTLDLNTEGNETTTWRQVENSFSVEQAAENSNNQCDLNSRRHFFDLNVSVGQCRAEENFDACQITESRFHAIHKEDSMQECETSRNSDWHTMSNIKAPHSYEQRVELDLQVPSVADRLANKLTASEVPTAKDATQVQCGSGFFTEVDRLCSQGDILGNVTCADYCSGEDETGGGFVEVKSSDGSGLTSCESRDAVHLELTKAKDYSNTSSGEACQSRESRIPGHKDDEAAAFSSNVVRKRSIGLPLEKVDGVVGNQEWESLLFSTAPSAPGFSQHDTTRNCSKFTCTEFGDESEAANSGGRKHLVEAAEAAELLLSLGFDLPSVTAGEGDAINDPEKSLDWLADIIPQEENCEAQVLDAGISFMAMHEGRSTRPALEDASEKALDPFEMAVLALKPIDPDTECLTTQVMDKSKENCPPLPTLRRRSSRRGRAGKDFQREMLRSMISLSRHEITEDLQMIEGLIKSTTEPINTCCSPSPSLPEDKPLSSPEPGASKDSGKAKGTKACRGRKLSGTLKVCSWGESTRRKRMGRQRSQWLCLPPGVQTSLFLNNAGDGLF